MIDTLDKICQHSDCTFSQTGQCIYGREQSTCPERLESIAELVVEDLSVAGASVLTPPEEMERLSPSLYLSDFDTERITRNRYCKVVAILGVPGTGKTASLVSLYLLLAHNALDEYRFLDSKTVMGFEEISMGARTWNVNQPPEQFTAHTELTDERTAGFLHLRIQNVSNKRKMDFLLTDLPGEWTNTLIDTNRTDRLSFLKSSDRIWITVNSEHIATAKSRKLVVHRLKLLVDRIRTFLVENIPDMTIVLTHSDKTDSVKEYLKPLQSLAVGFSIVYKEIASFSSEESIVPGTGIKELIDDLAVARGSSRAEFWPDQSFEQGRNMLRYQGNRN
ncbi:hypothetical protein HP439_17575 [Sphingobacterium shayense]|uniref:TRAFAC clade GTPase domain-containing protein n=1 Tax=Sphingobacterium shayense TaxID=626343 RepID=UPI00155797AA|nr:hypothetical protein [Sphingobacterium shayense]NQD72537.1 hypothetical protein [Sphingobacterium shayense]